jgi:predicted ATPase with chaperone activity
MGTAPDEQYAAIANSWDFSPWQTVTDLKAKENIRSAHLTEAIQYRSLDRSYWT